MYQIVSALNGLIREEMMSNPFDFISDNELIVVLFTYLIGGLILHIISFAMCGVFYDRGSCPTLGSIGYMFFFALNVGILMTISQWFNSCLAIGIIYMVLVITIFIILIHFLYPIHIHIQKNQCGFMIKEIDWLTHITK